MRNSILTLLIAVTVTLAGCGGGGGNVRPELPTQMQPTPEPGPDQNDDDDEMDPDPEPDPPQPPELSFDEQTRETLQAVIDASSTTTDASTIDGESFLWSTATQPTPSSLTLGDIAGSSGEFEDLGSQRGVSLAIARSESSINTFVDYGGWLDYGFFLVQSTLTVGGDVLHRMETVSTDTYSIGEASGSNPISGGATWTGVMAGINANEDATTFSNLVTGDAVVSIDDFSQPAVDVAFTGITDAKTGTRHSDIRWDGLALDNGAFADNIDDVTGDTLASPLYQALGGGPPPPGALTPGQISGQFYGPNHEEVGGVFERGGIVGAFGATR